MRRALVNLAALVLSFPAFAQAYPPAVQQAIRSATDCPAGQTAKPADFLLQGEFNGDGVPDYIVDAGRVPCPDLSLCGSAGCTSTAWLSKPGGHSAVGLGNVQSIDVVRIPPRDLLSVVLHGSACGKAGAAECRRTLEWNGTKFAVAANPRPSVPAAPAKGVISAWGVEKRGPTTMAVGKAMAGTWRVQLDCIRSSIGLDFILKPRKAWDGGASTALVIDGVTVPMSADGAGEFGLLLSDTPNGSGIGRATLQRIAGAKSLVLDGPAAARVPLAERTFSLDGAVAAFTAAGLFACPVLR